MNEGVVEYFSEICTFGLAHLAEVVDEWSIEQTKLLAHTLEVAGHVIQTILPELPNEEPSSTIVLIQIRNELPQEVLTEMLNSIKPNSLQSDLLAEPLPPILNILLNLRMIIVEICEHEIIIVALLTINIASCSPTFSLVSQDLVDSCLIVLSVIVGAGEVIPMILLSRMLFAAAREVEAEPGVDFVGVGNGFVAIFLVDFLGFAFFFVVGCCFVIED